ncbi:MAG TPA: hypothetical protein VK158_01450 [Acidobacteriota bacterium]|nr:hypothetical protein [Acidobacteriota bacterium]
MTQIKREVTARLKSVENYVGLPYFHNPAVQNTVFWVHPFFSRFMHKGDTTFTTESVYDRALPEILTRYDETKDMPELFDDNLEKKLQKLQRFDLLKKTLTLKRNQECIGWRLWNVLAEERLYQTLSATPNMNIVYLIGLNRAELENIHDGKCDAIEPDHPLQRFMQGRKNTQPVAKEYFALTFNHHGTMSAYSGGIGIYSSSAFEQTLAGITRNSAIRLNNQTNHLVGTFGEMCVTHAFFELQFDIANLNVALDDCVREDCSNKKVAFSNRMRDFYTRPHTLQEAIEKVGTEINQWAPFRTKIKPFLRDKCVSRARLINRSYAKKSTVHVYDYSLTNPNPNAKALTVTL